MRFNFLRPALMTAAIVASAGILAGGLALRPAFAVGGSAVVGPFTVTHCTQSAPCKVYSNAGTGPGLRGINTNLATTGAGLIGTATQNGTGVVGQANAGVGVSGTSSTGFGVAASSTNSVGVIGTSTNSAGVAGTSSNSDGVFGQSSSSYGVEGTTNSNGPTVAGIQGDNVASSVAVRANGFGGPLFVGNNSANVDVFTVDNGGNVGIVGSTSVTGTSGFDALDAGTAASITGVAGVGFLGVTGTGAGAGPFGVFAYNAATSGGDALGVQDLTDTGVLINGYDGIGALKLQVQDDGTVLAHNFVIAFDAPAGQKVTTYATMSSTPSVEDFGEAQLTAGQTYVSLTRAYAAAIDSRFAYMVFITPEGDTRGLYVTQKTPAGFVVRENQGGRSEAAFSYRIVAKPYGSTSATLRPSIAPPHRLPHMPTMAKLRHAPKTKPQGQWSGRP